jgi:hypothetical protein
MDISSMSPEMIAQAQASMRGMSPEALAAMQKQFFDMDPEARLRADTAVVLP